jgi:heme A synthase
MHSAVGQRGHILVAFAVVTAVALLVRIVFERRDGEKPMALAVGFLAVLVAMQVLLGVEALLPFTVTTPGRLEGAA